MARPITPADIARRLGVITSGHDLDELRAALVEAITFYLEGERSSGVPQARASAHVDEMRVLVSP